MRFTSVPLRSLVAVALICVASGPAVSQSFFQSLFGFGAAKPAEKVAPRSKPVPSLQSFRRSRPSGSESNASEAASDGASYDDENPNGPYRTMCVRTCDGYYFPISPRASQSRFKRDAKMCQQMCGHEAKLFYMPRDSSNVKDMETVDGETYSSLPKAFAYRKSLVSGCSCKPMPWSDAEKARHSFYAVKEAVEKSQRDAFEQRLAGEKAEAEVLKIVKTLHLQPAAEPDLAKVPTDPATAAPELILAVSMPIEIGSDDQDHAGSDASGTSHLHLMPGAVAIQASHETAPDQGQVNSRGHERPRRTWSRARQKQRSIQTASWQFGGGGKYTWPGDAPARRR